MTRFGLCDDCAWQRLVTTGRGSVFTMCLRHREDPRFAKYPRVPVGTCPGHDPVPAPRQSGRDQTRD